MDSDVIAEVLRFANDDLVPVRLVLKDGTEVVGVPTVVDIDDVTEEIFLQPEGDDAVEIGVTLAAIKLAELV
jgi:hypothetical protein